MTTAHLDEWRDRAGLIDTAGLRNLATGNLDCLFFRWSDLDDELQDLAIEQLGPEAQDAVLEGSLTPFAVLGSTEESGEELTLENVLDTQIDGMLLYDSDLVVYSADEGRLTRQDITVDALAVSLR
jgi:hypothetical protein